MLGLHRVNDRFHCLVTVWLRCRGSRSASRSSPKAAARHGLHWPSGRCLPEVLIRRDGCQTIGRVATLFFSALVMRNSRCETIDARMLLTGFSALSHASRTAFDRHTWTFAGHAVVSRIPPGEVGHSAGTSRTTNRLLPFRTQARTKPSSSETAFEDRVRHRGQFANLDQLILWNAFDRLSVDGHVLAGKQLSGLCVGRPDPPSGSRGLIWQSVSLRSSACRAQRARFQRFGIDAKRQHPVNQRTQLEVQEVLGFVRCPSW